MKFIIENRATLSGAPPQLLQELVERFTIENPDYLSAVKMGRSTFSADRWLCFAEQGPGGAVSYPRGAGRAIYEEALRHDQVEIVDNRVSLPEVNLEFSGKLRPYQDRAVAGMLAKDFGVLEAGTGSGKTVMALAVIAARKQPALVIVHAKELLYQWRDRILQLLGIEAGLIGDGKFDVRPITVGIINSVKKSLPCLVDQFGHLVVDECHRVPASLFSETITAFPARYMVGLSATPYRADGLGPLIGWFLGQHRVKVEMAILKQLGAILRPRIVTRPTEFRYLYRDDYSRMVSALSEDVARNRLIAADIQEQASKGGFTLVVSDRTGHLAALADLAGVGKSEVLTGKTTARKRMAIVASIASGEVDVLFSTFSLIGEGFDCPAMDAVFLASPVKSEGRLRQVVGRVLRPAAGKEPTVFDYHDMHVGVLSHQWRVRRETLLEMSV